MNAVAEHSTNKAYFSHRILVRQSVSPCKKLWAHYQLISSLFASGAEGEHSK